MYRNIFLICFLIIASVSMAQNQNYEPLECKGNIPEEFISSTTSKYLNAKSELRTKDIKWNKKKTHKDFLLVSNYNIDKILRSGYTLYGDKVTNYINDVADIIFENDTKLRNELRFYTLKSSKVNAFSTHQGIVFVNLGLLAQIENEAQLAYILAHESVHYTKEHVLNSYTETQDLIKNKRGYRGYSIDEKVELFYDYSKDNEIEADEIGLEYYMKTDYPTKEAQKVFDVLLYSYLPFDELVFDISLIENKYYKFDKEYFMEKTDDITAIEDYDDSESTHPNIKKRRDNINELMERKDDEKKGNANLLGEERFNEIQKIARFELCRVLAENKHYGKALYNTYVMLQKYPDNQYLKKTLSQILYGISRYKSQDILHEVLLDYDDTEGNWQQVFYFLDKVPGEDISTLSLDYIWKLYQEDRKDKSLKKLAAGIIEDLVEEHELDYTYYKDESDTSTSFVELSEEEYNKLSKYEKIDYKKELSDNEETSKQLRYALSDILKDKEFKNLFFEIEDKVAKRNEWLEDEENKDLETKKQEEKIEKEIEKEKELYGEKLGIDTIVLVTPQYAEYDYRKETPFQYIDSEKKQQTIIDFNTKFADKLGIKLNVLDIKNLNSADYDKFNDYINFNKWFSELAKTYKFEDIQDLSKEMNFELINQAYADNLVTKYNTRYYAICGGIVI